MGRAGGTKDWQSWIYLGAPSGTKKKEPLRAKAGDTSGNKERGRAVMVGSVGHIRGE